MYFLKIFPFVYLFVLIVFFEGSRHWLFDSDWVGNQSIRRNLFGLGV